jgi:hypothetical protein
LRPDCRHKSAGFSLNYDGLRPNQSAIKLTCEPSASRNIVAKKRRRIRVGAQILSPHAPKTTQKVVGQAHPSYSESPLKTLVHKF